MKRLYAIPFISALVGGGVVVAVIAATSGLGSSTKTVTEVQAAPLAVAGTTSSAAQSAGKSTGGLTAHEIYVRTSPGVVYVTSTIVRQN